MKSNFLQVAAHYPANCRAMHLASPLHDLYDPSFGTRVRHGLTWTLRYLFFSDPERRALEGALSAPPPVLTIPPALPIALHSSPVALLAHLYAHLLANTDCNGVLDKVCTTEELITVRHRNPFVIIVILLTPL